jgi:hypothetical protein
MYVKHNDKGRIIQIRDRRMAQDDGKTTLIFTWMIQRKSIYFYAVNWRIY